MKKTPISTKKHIFFVGIGGISMSGLAILMVNYGKKVSGSDYQFSEITKHLEQKNVSVFYEHSEKNLAADVDLVVFSGAISPDNPELTESKKRGIEIVERSEFLGWVCGFFNNVIAISGTHGKTTTTALIGEILLQAELNPTIHVGGEVNDSYHNFRIGGNRFFVTEACEYKKSLEYIASNVAVITNIEKDHMDCYKDIADLYVTFLKFAGNCKEALIVTQHDNILANINHSNVITCASTPSGTFFVKRLKANKLGCFSFVVYKNNEFFGKFELNIQGRYNVFNALLAIAVADYYNINIKTMQKGLKNFNGIKRRNEFIGTYAGYNFFADYAHHPTEIKNSIKNYKKIYGKVLVIFQPHTFSRTLTLKEEFTDCFNEANKLIVFKTYAAREKPMEGGSETDMFHYISFSLKNKFLALDEKDLKHAIDTNLKNCKCVLVLGAGDLYYLIHNVIYLKK